MLLPNSGFGPCLPLLMCLRHCLEFNNKHFSAIITRNHILVLNVFHVFLKYFYIFLYKRKGKSLLKMYPRSIRWICLCFMRSLFSLDMRLPMCIYDLVSGFTDITMEKLNFSCNTQIALYSNKHYICNLNFG